MQVKPIKMSDITVNRDKRQRSTVKDLDGLKTSLTSIGLINPITVDKDNNLITGERRLAAAKALGWTEIDVQCLEDLSPTQLKIIELEENVKRADLPWQDKIKAVLEVSTLLRKEQGLTLAQAAGYIGLSDGHLSRSIVLAQALTKTENADLLQANTQASAYAALQRRFERAAANELDQIGRVKTVTSAEDETPSKFDLDIDVDVDTLAQEVIEADTKEPVITVDFHKWAKSYAGERFNFVHCDFPYGVDHHKSEQGGAKTRETYEDDPDVFWELVNTLLVHRDNFMAHQCHIMLWFSMNNYSALFERFGQVAFTSDIVWQPYPLYWYKDDNTGIVPDVKRGPRRVVETALLGIRGDRNVVKPVSNCFPYPGDKKDMQHISEKPEDMLYHFFRMLVDESTMLLDPTCGAGSALRAAKRLKARKILGIEKDPAFAERAFNSLEKE